MIEFGILLVYSCNYVVLVNNYVCYFPMYLPLDIMHHVLQFKISKHNVKGRRLCSTNQEHRLSLE